MLQKHRARVASSLEGVRTKSPSSLGGARNKSKWTYHGLTHYCSCALEAGTSFAAAKSATFARRRADGGSRSGEYGRLFFENILEPRSYTCTYHICYMHVCMYMCNALEYLSPPREEARLLGRRRCVHDTSQRFVTSTADFQRQKLAREHK